MEIALRMSIGSLWKCWHGNCKSRGKKGVTVWLSLRHLVHDIFCSIFPVTNKFQNSATFECNSLSYGLPWLVRLPLHGLTSSNILSYIYKRYSSASAECLANKVSNNIYICHKYCNEWNINDTYILHSRNFSGNLLIVSEILQDQRSRIELKSNVPTSRIRSSFWTSLVVAQNSLEKCSKMVATCYCLKNCIWIAKDTLVS